MLNRRELLQRGLAFGSVLALPRLAWAQGAPKEPGARTLVLLHLNGGNDGLNTVIPFTDPMYRILRPGLAVDDGQIRKIDGKLGLHLHAAQLVVGDGVGERDIDRALVAGLGSLDLLAELVGDAVLECQRFIDAQRKVLGIADDLIADLGRHVHDDEVAELGAAFLVMRMAEARQNAFLLGVHVVFVELPDVGRKVKAGEACAVVESVKTASDVYSPVSGEILEVNKAATDDPALVNREPFANGWFYKIKLANPAELTALLTPEQYQAQIKA